MSNNVYNIGDRRPVGERPLSQTVHAVAHEIREFIDTRVAMLQSEMREKLQNLRQAAPALIIGVSFAATAWLLFTGALVAILMVAFAGSPYAPFLAMLIIGVVYATFGAGALWMGLGRVGKKALVPERTIEVLKEDKIWLENEARSHL
jgi:uncharacterized membrane protein YqjE